MDRYSPEIVLTDPESEELADELKHWKVLVQKPLDIDELLALVEADARYVPNYWT